MKRNAVSYFKAESGARIAETKGVMIQTREVRVSPKLSEARTSLALNLNDS